MKLSNKTIKICKKHSNEFSTCVKCPIEKECDQYRNTSIRMYEEFKVRFKLLEEKVNVVYCNNNNFKWLKKS